ncbi:DNA-directed RNA polymerase subunit alpha [bacterium]|nr:MAG: DNA-directed RNA polymerase subunit alpha [bacterium]
MIDFNRFNLKTISEKSNEGSFVIGPLPRGYGYTLANMIRRVLYSSIMGVAITSVRVNNVMHEYSALDGITDDVLKILLKLKEIVFVLNTEDEVKLKLSKKGEGDVLADDFEDSSSVEILNPDFVITTLSSSKAVFELEITLKKEKGYQREDNEKRSEVGLIPLDSDFSPVKRVAYKVSQTRLGQDLDLDQIELDIYTNGSILPSEALKESSEVLNAITAHFVEVCHGKVVEVKKEGFAQGKKVDLSISKLNISTRLYNCLDKLNIQTLNDLEGKTKKEIGEIKGLGEKSKKELLKMLEKYQIEIVD